MWGGRKTALLFLYRKSNATTRVVHWFFYCREQVSIYVLQQTKNWKVPQEKFHNNTAPIR